MNIKSINKTNFGLRKFSSFNDIAKQKIIKTTKLDCSDIKQFKKHMKKVVLEAKKNLIKAEESAKKIILG